MLLQMSDEELYRGQILQEILDGRLSQIKAAAKLSISPRQLCRPSAATTRTRAFVFSA